jgi:hypothetical protein
MCQSKSFLCGGQEPYRSNNEGDPRSEDLACRPRISKSGQWMMSLPTLSRSDNQYDVFMHPTPNDLPSVCLRMRPLREHRSVGHSSILATVQVKSLESRSDVLQSRQSSRYEPYSFASSPGRRFPVRVIPANSDIGPRHSIHPARGFETHSLRVKIIRSLAPSLRLPALVIYQPRLYHLELFTSTRLER